MKTCAVCEKVLNHLSTPIACVVCERPAHKTCSKLKDKFEETVKSGNYECMKCVPPSGEVRMPKTSGMEDMSTKDDIQRIIEEIQSGNETIEGKIDKLDNKVENLRKRVDATETNIKTQEHEITKINANAEYQAEYSRRNNLEIHGIPFVANEDLFEILQRLGDCLEVDIRPGHIDAVHRINTNAAVKPIIVKFVNRWKREELLQRKKGDLLWIYSPLRIYLQENLTPQKRFLAIRTRA